MTMIRTAVVVAAGSVSLLAAQGASAGPLLCAAGTCVWSYSSPGTSLPAAVDIPYFNPAAGTLTSVTIDVTPTVTLESGMVLNNSTTHTVTAATLDVTALLNFDDSAGNGDLMAAVGLGGNELSSPISRLVPVPIAPGHSADATGLPQNFTGLTGIAYTTGPSLADWISSPGNSYDPLSLTLTPIFSAHVTGSNAILAGGVVDSSVDVSVTYTYTAPETVPEPATALMLASGLGGLMMIRRRRRG